MPIRLQQRAQHIPVHLDVINNQYFRWSIHVSKSEIRSTKSETNTVKQRQIRKIQNGGSESRFGWNIIFGFIVFEFVSDFDIRICLATLFALAQNRPKNIGQLGSFLDENISLFF